MSDMTRRNFLKISAGFAVAGLLPKTLFSLAPSTSRGPALGVARGEPSRLVAAAVDAIGGIGSFVKPGDRVCIKPNISFAANTDCGATTNSQIVKQIVQLCLDAGADKVIVFDHTIADAVLCVEKSRIEQAIVDPKRVSLLTLTKERQFSEVSVPRGTELETIQVAKVFLESDKFINVPTAKSHSATGVSLGIKNLMGLIWDRGYLHRMNLHRAIAELATVMQPDLTIVDATRALTSGGPGGPGKTTVLNTVIAGTDMVAVDSYAVGLTPWYNRSFVGAHVKHLAAAHEFGIGEISTDKMRITEVEA